MGATKTINIYAREDEGFILIPTSVGSNGFLKEIECVDELRQPYSDSDIEKAITRTLELCSTKSPDDTTKTTIIEKHLGIKGYKKATEFTKLINIEWSNEKGYRILPTNRDSRGRYSFLPLSKHIVLSNDVNSEELATAVKKAIEISTF